MKEATEASPEESAVIGRSDGVLETPDKFENKTSEAL